MSDSKSAHTKLSAARTRLVIERPFIGALVMHLPLKAAAARWCSTVASDARTVYFNPAYVEHLEFAHAQFVLAHVALHCALGHFSRRAHRVRHRWDIACDHAVNLLLIDDGLKPAPGALADPRFRGLSAEEIYPLVDVEPVDETLDQHVGDIAWYGAAHGMSAPDRIPDAPLADAAPDSWDDAGNEQQSTDTLSLPVQLSSQEHAALELQWKSRTAAAAQRARLAGRLAPSWERLLADLVEPQLPWRVLLARYLMSVARDDYSYQRLSRREGPALLPRLASGESDVCVALDTSGSIGERELAEFACEIDALKSQIRARVTLLACDERLDERGPWRFEAWEPVQIPSALGGGGGTSFAPVFEWLTREHYRPDVLIYFTDGAGDFPDCAPDCPVVWLVKGKAPVPWGERIQLV